MITSHKTAPPTPSRFCEIHLGADYTEEEIEFLQAVDLLRKTRKFPTMRELFQLLLSLGYRRSPCSCSSSSTEERSTS